VGVIRGVGGEVTCMGSVVSVMSIVMCTLQ
jgi:hypothetical protein